MPDDPDTGLDPDAWAAGLWLIEHMAAGNRTAAELLRYVCWLEAEVAQQNATIAELVAGVREAAELGF